jgi:hypothetical protein
MMARLDPDKIGPARFQRLIKSQAHEAAERLCVPKTLSELMT